MPRSALLRLQCIKLPGADVSCVPAVRSHLRSQAAMDSAVSLLERQLPCEVRAASLDARTMPCGEVQRGSGSQPQ